MMTVLAGPDPHHVRTLGLPAVPDLVRAATPVRANGRVRLRRTTRIGVPPDYLTGVSAPVLALRKKFLTALEAIPGARTVQVSYPDDWSLLTGAFNDARLSERTEPFRPWLRKDLKLFGVSVLSWLGGLMLSGDEWSGSGGGLPGRHGLALAPARRSAPVQAEDPGRTTTDRRRQRRPAERLNKAPPSAPVGRGPGPDTVPGLRAADRHHGSRRRCDQSNFITQVEPNAARSQFGPDTTVRSWR